MKKIVVKLAIDVVAGVQGVDSVAVDMEKNQITGAVNPLYLASTFRKFGFTELVSEEKKSQSDSEKENKAQVQRTVFVPCCRQSKYTVVIEDNLHVVDMEKNQITVIGAVNPLYLASTFRKFGKSEKEEENKAQAQRIVFVPCCRSSEYSVVTEDNLINSCDHPTNVCTIC